MKLSQESLERQVLKSVVKEASKTDLKKISLSLHAEITRYCEIIKQLVGVKQLSNNGLLHPVSNLLVCRKSYKQKWDLVQQICWQYVEVSTAIDWICENNLYKEIKADSVEKLVNALAIFYTEKVPAILGENAFQFFMSQYKQMSIIEIVDILDMEYEKLSRKVSAFHCLHKRILKG
jgi:hypothetical protein